MKAEICEGAYFLPRDFDPGIAIVGLDDVVGDELLVLGHHRIVHAAADQALDREEGVFGVGDAPGAWPAGRPAVSPSALKATIDGVVRAPSAFSMTLGVLPSMTATHELVVPRSIPITLAIVTILLVADPPWKPCVRRFRDPGRRGGQPPDSTYGPRLPDCQAVAAFRWAI